jgi:hypothetical protein
MVGEGRGAFRSAHQQPYRAAEGEKLPDDLLPYESGASRDKNHNTALKYRNLNVGRKIGAGHAERSGRIVTACRLSAEWRDSADNNFFWQKLRFR